MVKKEPASQIMDYGTLGHKLILGKSADILVGKMGRLENRCVEIGFRQEAQEAGKTAVLQKTMDRAQEMASAAELDMSLLGYEARFKDAIKEVSGIWKHSDQWMRSKFDAVYFGPSTAHIFDLKITDNASPLSIERRIGQMNYDLQESFYTDGVEQLRPDLSGRVLFTFLFIESTFPYCVVPG